MSRVDLEKLLLGIDDELEAEDDPPLDERLVRLVNGQLSGIELEELEIEAESSEGLAADIRAFTPLDPSFVERSTQAVLALPRVAPTAPQKWTWPSWWPWALAGLAVAVALVVMVPRAPTPLPTYEAAWLTSYAPLRSEGPEVRVARLHRGSVFRLSLRPTTAVGEAVAIRAWLAGNPVSLTTEISGVGAVQLEGRIGEGELDLQPGSYTLVVAVGPATGRHPGTPTQMPESWQRHELPFTVHSEP